MSQTIATSHESTETRTRLLEAAGRLFAERGYEATSVRDITAEAECNVASVNYHFGGKENLYFESFRELVTELRDRRTEAIRRDMSAVEEPTLEYFLESFAAGFMDPLVGDGSGRRFLTIINREMADPHLPRELFVEEFLNPMMEVAGEALVRVAPSLDPDTARLCLMSMVSQLLHALMIRKHFVREEGATVVPGDLNNHIAHIVRFTAGGVRACVGDGPTAGGRSEVGSDR